MQYQIAPDELRMVLALARSGTLAAAAERLGQNPSTVFRALNRMEKGLGQPVFERSRQGYHANDLGLQLAEHAERIEAELDAARAATHSQAQAVAGRVRLSTTDTLLYGLVLPVLPGLMRAHSLLELELMAGNELANLTQRDADLALRATRTPAPHLVGRHLGPLRAAVFAPRALARRKGFDWMQGPWVVPDDALPEHLSVQWRRRHQPKARVQTRVGSVQAVVEAVAAGLGVGIAPLFMAQGRSDVVAVTPPLPECETQLWLLAHPASRHLRRIATVYAYLTQQINLA